MSDYKTLLGHLKHHGVRRALERMCENEDANTIRRALRRVSDDKLNAAIALALAQDW